MAFLEEFREAGFSEAELVRAVRNGRTRSPYALAALVRAVR